EERLRQLLVVIQPAAVRICPFLRTRSLEQLRVDDPKSLDGVTGLVGIAILILFVLDVARLDLMDQLPDLLAGRRSERHLCPAARRTILNTEEDIQLRP